MDNGISRKNILVSFLDLLYKEFGDDAPSLVRFPVHVALWIAHKANPKERDSFKRATKAEVEEAIKQSRHATAYAKAGWLQGKRTGQLLSAIRKTQRSGIDAMALMKEAVDAVHEKLEEIDSNVAKVNTNVGSIRRELCEMWRNSEYNFKELDRKLDIVIERDSRR